MNNLPELYDKSNKLQRQDSSYIFHRLKQIDDQLDLLVDLGCGSGNLTSDFTNCVQVNRAVGIDISKPMIEYAKKTYSNEKIDFKVADVCEDWDRLSSSTGICPEQVDIVTSSYCLHWVSDVQKAMNNIFKMLKPGGSCFMIMFSWSQLLPIQEQITFHPRWADIFRQHLACDPEEKPMIKSVDKDLNLPIKARRKSSAPFPVFEIPSPDDRIKKWAQLCQNSGLIPVKVQVHDSTFTYQDIQGFRGELQSLCHYLVYIPEDLKDKFMEDYFEHMDNCYIKRQENLPQVKVDYQFLSVIARKPLKFEADNPIVECKSSETMIS